MPDPVCHRCSTAIAPGTGSRFAGRPVHMRCLAQATQIGAIEQRNRAGRETQRAPVATPEAEALVAPARVRNRICPVCDRPLIAGGSVLFQGDVLVHALCWRPAESDRTPPDAPSPRS